MIVVVDLHWFTLLLFLASILLCMIGAVLERTTARRAQFASFVYANGVGMQAIASTMGVFLLFRWLFLHALR